MELEVLQENIFPIIVVLSLFCFILFILCVISLLKISKLKKRINMFMKPQKEDDDIEHMLIDYLEQVKNINSRYDTITDSISAINNRLKGCIQKVGIVRYNPFKDMGGDLCYAVAILDDRDNGIVFNSIYSREGCYTYSKPIEDSKCERYKLSDEEIQAIEIAKQNHKNKSNYEK